MVEENRLTENRKLPTFTSKAKPTRSPLPLNVLIDRTSCVVPLYLLLQKWHQSRYHMSRKPGLAMDIANRSVLP